MTTELIRYDAFQTALAEAKTIPQIKNLADQADLFRQWLKKQKAGIEAENNGAIICLQAQRKLGEMLSNINLNKGAAEEGWKTQLHHATTLNELNIEKTQSHRWQKLAEIPEDDFQQFITEYLSIQDGITRAGLFKFFAQKTITPLKDYPPLPEGKFRVIAIDPPWQYGTTYNPDNRRVGAPYHEMSFEQLAALEIPAADDSILWLWTTNAFMREALELSEIWQFEQKSILTWFKERTGVGYWLRGETEHCLLCTRGETHKLSDEAFTTHLKVKSTNHSAKPNEFYTVVESLCGEASEETHLEMFARKKRQNWKTWGNEVGD